MGDAPSRLGRLLFSGTLVYMAIDGFRNNDKRVEIAAQKGLPNADVAVPVVTGMLLVANIGILLWRFPRASVGAVILFFLGTTPVIHDFWTMEGQERQANKVNFCKNVALLGGAVLLLSEAAGDGDGDADDR
ncbi:DoxX family protein [Haloarchaeobius litoreus]|uniref:DoxX family protein n=1 Tax=Haloarchaeobius litoreus TaxID=755306 RepID=A0ABD6DNI0_9EURY|nr:DoxX family protein [Haloarchaeobius litoreus]